MSKTYTQKNVQRWAKILTGGKLTLAFYSQPIGGRLPLELCQALLFCLTNKGQPMPELRRSRLGANATTTEDLRNLADLCRETVAKGA